MINFFSKYKFIFYITNMLVIFLYLFPGSLIGYFLYNDFETHPQLTPDLIISTNHFYMFFVITILGYFTFLNSIYINRLILYLLFLSLTLELLHIAIPNRGFQFSDLFGNLFGVMTVVIINFINKKYENFKK